MSPVSFRLLRVSVLAAGLAALPLASASAQNGARSQPATLPRELHAIGPQAAGDERSADQLRNDFENLMRQYPPSLGEVLKLDPTLMTSPAYLQNYPALASFLATHPDIPRNPRYFLSFARTSAEVSNYTYSPTQDLIQSLSVASVFVGIAIALAWLVRTFLTHRRWLRSTKLQMDIHNRLMERLSSSADVQTYLASAATNRLLVDMPVNLDGGGSGPAGRILLSVQVGLIMAAAGIGLLLGQRYVPRVDNALTIPGILALAIGVGFVAAAGASYILSVRLGLLDSSAADPADRPGA